MFHPLKELAFTLKVWLYDNNFTDVDGKFFARAQTENTAGVDDVVESGAARGEIVGNVEEAKQHVHGFLNEAIRILLGGYSVHLDYFRLAASVTGSFDSATEPFDRKKHAIRINFYILDALRQIIEEQAKVDVQGIAAVQGIIDHVLDIASDLTDEILTPGHQVHIYGSKIKVFGTGADIGVFFINVTGDRFKATEISDNTAGKLSLRVPDNLAAGLYTIEIVTKYSQSGAKPLKNARTISFLTQLRVNG
ncbi:hypothetical protein Barb6XT_00586 [Bacteroidales bacterium Barb6XT]|nr:hypothetical protein Barb6XT_00586 [Bacteroidales bacterium Barb6XT]